MSAIQDITLNLSTIIKEFGKILEVFNERLADINSPRTLFAKDHKLNPTELAGRGSNPDQNLPGR